MPLNPSPVTVNTLHWTQGTIEIQRYDDGDTEYNQRMVLLNWDGVDLGDTEAVVPEELHELAQALLDQAEWLGYSEPPNSAIDYEAQSCDWVVVEVHINASTKSYGPMTRSNADRLSDEVFQKEDVVTMLVTQLETWLPV